MAGIRRTLEYVFDLNAAGLARGARQATSSLDEMKNAAQGVAREFDDIKAPDIEVGMDFKSGAIANVRRRLEEQRRELERSLADVNIDVDPSEAIRTLRRIEREVRQLDRMDVDIDVDVDKDGRLSRGLGRITDGAAGLAREIPLIGGALAALPPQAQAAAAGVAAAVATITAATAGPALLGGGFAAGAGFTGFKFLEAYARDAQEMQKWTVVFGDSIGEMEKFADRMSRATGLINDDVLLASAGIADLLKPKGFTEGEAAGITQQLYERAAALAKFSGRDTSEGVAAVTSAITGSSRALKQFGIDVSDKNIGLDAVVEDLKRTKDGFDELPESQQRIIALQETITRQGRDSWRSWQKGPSDAEKAIFNLKATIEGLKDVALGGFGQILADVIGDFGRLNSIGDTLIGAPDKLENWIKRNRDQIRVFFTDVGAFAIDGADSFLAFGQAILEMVGFAAPALEQFLQGFLDTSSNIALSVGNMFRGLPGFQALGQSLIDQAVATKQMSVDIEGWGDKVGAGAQAASDGLRRFRTEQLGPLREDWARLQQIAVLQLSVRSGRIDLGEAERQLAGITDKRQIVELIANIPDNTKNKALQELEKLARARKAEIVAEAKTDKANRDMDRAARRRTARIDLKLGDVIGGQQTLLVKNPRGQVRPVRIYSPGGD